MQTNILHYFAQSFGAQGLVDAITNAKQYQQNSRLVPITNPIIRFLAATTVVKGKKLETNFRMTVPPSDYRLFNFVGACLKLLQDEIKSNEPYRKELARGLLGLDEGPALTGINELTAAAYYKHSGHTVILHSSLDKGMPDVDVTDTDYATDAKTFSNQRYQLRATINESKDELEKCFADVGDGVLLLSMWKPGKSEFKGSLKNLKQAFQQIPFSHYEDDNMHVIVMGQEYKGGDLELRMPMQNLTLHFQASWAMDDALEQLKKGIEKSVKQSANAGKQAITWVVFPEDAARHGIEMQVVRHMAELEQFVSETEGLEGLVFYSIEADRDNAARTGLSVDVYGSTMQHFGITKENVMAFISEMHGIKEVLIP